MGFEEVQQLLSNNDGVVAIDDSGALGSGNTTNSVAGLFLWPSPPQSLLFCERPPPRNRAAEVKRRASAVYTRTCCANIIISG